MRKRKVDTAVLPGQLPLNFDVFTVEMPHGIVAAAGTNKLDASIRQAFCIVLERAFTKGMSRDRLADQLTELLGRPISKAQLDQWSAPSQADRRLPVDVWITVMTITDDFSPLEWMALNAGRRVLTVDEALCAEFGAMAVLDRHIRAKQKVIEGKMDEKLLGQVMQRIHAQQSSK